jgi:hypothetical protein
MSLFSKIFGKRKTESFDNNQLVTVLSQINENYALSEKYFEKFDLLTQRELITTFYKNNNLYNRKVLIKDFENYIKLSQYDIDNKILEEYCKSHTNQDRIEVSTFLHELSHYLYEYDLHNLSSSNYVDLIYSLQQISADREYLEEYLFSITLVRYLESETFKKSFHFLNLFRSTPLWYTSHMYLDLKNSIKKGKDNNSINYLSNSVLFNTLNNGQKISFRHSPLLN